MLPSRAYPTFSAHLTPERYAAATAALDQVLDARTQGRLSAPFATAMGQALEGYLTSGRFAVSPMVEEELQRMPPRERDIVAAMIERMRLDLKTLPSLTDAGAQDLHADAEVHALAVRVGEVAAAMRLAHEREPLVSYTTEIIANVARDSAYAGAVARAARRHGLTLAQVAPAAFAAVTAYRPMKRWHSPQQVLQTLELASGSNIPSRRLGAIADELTEVLRHQDAALVQGAAQLMETDRESAFGVTAVADPTGPLAITGPLPGTPAPTDDPRVNLKTLVGFFAQGRGESGAGRVEGSLLLLRDVQAVAVGRTGRGFPMAEAAQQRFHQSLDALSRLSKRVRGEQQVYKTVTELWKPVLAEMERMQRQAAARGNFAKKGPPSAPEEIILPLPDLGPVEMRSMYYQEALRLGMPLSAVLAELYDVDDITFGPTERLWFERLAFYGARKYAADFAARHSALPLQLAIKDERMVARVRDTLGDLEGKLRSYWYETDAALLDRGRQLLKDRVGEGLNSGQVARLLGDRECPEGIVGEMITRIRAEQEVRLLTAQIAVWGRIPERIMLGLRHLPHARRFARQGQVIRFDEQKCRNNQTLRELNTATQARWIEARSGLAPYLDAKPIEVPGVRSEELDDANPFHLKTYQPGNGKGRPAPRRDDRRRDDDEDEPSKGRRR